MCRRLGRKHLEYTDRRKNLYIPNKDVGRVSTDGTLNVGAKLVMQRAYNGRRIVELYGFNALNAFTDLRDKFNDGEQFSLNLRQTPAKRDRLVHIAYSHDRVGPGHYTNVRRADHLKRNNVKATGRV
jgi:hypothetical protein